MRTGIRHQGSGIRGAFSLLELSVVIGVISLIAGAGMTVALNALNTADRISTQEKLTTIRMAIDSYAKTYGYLPCPFDRALLTSSASFGVENRAAIAGAAPLQYSNCGATAGTSFINNSTIVIGGVPVRSLGLPDSYAGDAWGNKFTYTITASMASDPTRYSWKTPALSVVYNGSSAYNVTSIRNTLSSGTGSNDGSGKLRVTYGSTGSITTSVIAHISSASYKGSYTPSAKTGTTVDFSSITYTNPDTAAITIEWQEPGNAASYTVVSHGPNGMGAYPMNGTSVAKTCSNTGSPLDYYNCDDNSAFYDTDYNDGAVVASFFDDYIIYGSNEGFRKAVNNNVYTSASANSCPTGVCEVWCARCEYNYPGAAEAAVPPATVLNDTTNAVSILCRKVITSSSSDCKASCFWSGERSTADAAQGFYKCP